MTAVPSILIVDDDADVREMLRDYLQEYFQILEADCATAARAVIDKVRPHVALLDVGLPGEDGLSLARHCRERYDFGIIMVSGANETVDRIIGLEIGADDYVSKPFDPRELLARIRSVLRRTGASRDPDTGLSAEAVQTPAENSQRIAMGACYLDVQSHQLLDSSGNEIPITSMEYDLLQVFSERPNRVLSRDQLLTLTQNREWDPYDRSIDIRIARLRKKLEVDPDKPQCIKTIRGSGYMFVLPK